MTIDRRLRIRPIVTAFVIAAVGLMLGGCDLLSPASDESATVGIGFEAISSSAESGKRTGRSAALQEEIVVEGTNGTLILSDIRFVVAEFEVEGEDEACGDDADDCHEFEASPAFVDLPMASEDASPVVTEEISRGMYTELEFEVEDLDLEDGDDEEQYQELAAEIHETFAEWPEGASMVVVGEFAPADGNDPRPFTTFFDAEIEVELELRPPLEVTGPGSSRDLTIQLSPARWFAAAEGTVKDLSSSDYSSGGELVEFELELEEGFSESEVEIEVEG